MERIKKIAQELEGLTLEEKAFIIMDLAEQINDESPLVYNDFQLFAKVKKMSKSFILRNSELKES